MSISLFTYFNFNEEKMEYFREIIITTTEKVEKHNIYEYLGIISAHEIAGTSIFTDMVASLTDIFGGTSSTYITQLENLNILVLNSLKEKAGKIGANGIIGVHIDFDEISGKDKQMFMVTATGTAVKLVNENISNKIPNDENFTESNTKLSMSKAALNSAILLNEVVEGEFYEKNSISLELWDLAIKNKWVEIIPLISKLAD